MVTPTSSPTPTPTLTSPAGAHPGLPGTHTSPSYCRSPQVTRHPDRLLRERCGLSRWEGLHGLTWQAAGVGLEPPGGEILSLFPEVNTGHTTIMMSVNQTEDPELENKRVQTCNSHQTAQMTRWEKQMRKVSWDQTEQEGSPARPSQTPPGLLWL